MVSPARKQEAKEAARRLRYGSPKLRDILRDRCRSRVKEKRENGFFAQRNLSLEVAQIKNLVQQEFEKDLELQELVYAEMMEAMETWIDEEMNYLQNLEHQIVCPLCQKGFLNQIQLDRVTCTACQATLQCELPKLTAAIDEKTKLHKCPNAVGFYSENVTSLNMICFECDFFVKVL